MKSIFFTGKGGTGKSTLSAAAGWQLSQKGFSVLTVSLDPAHNLGDIFNIKLSDNKMKLRENLYLMEADTKKAADSYIKTNINLVKEVYGYLRAFNMDKYLKILKYSPGIEEYAILTILEKIFFQESDKFDYIVFDTPPTGLMLRIFALPEISLTWIKKLIKIRKTILSKRYTIHNIEGSYSPEGITLPYKESDDSVIIKLYELKNRYSKIKEILQGNSNSANIVFNPDILSIKESLRIIEGLKDLQIPVNYVFNNRVSISNIDSAVYAEKELLKQYPSLKMSRVSLSENIHTEGYILQEDITDLII